MTKPTSPIRRRILMLIPELGYGGAEKSFLRLSNLLAEYHEVTIAVFKRHYAKGNYACVEESISIPVTILDGAVHRNRLFRWITRWDKLRKLKKDQNVTISFLTGTNILNVATAGPGKAVVSMRGSRKYDPAFGFAKRVFYEFLIDPFTFLLADRIVSLSEGLSQELGKHVGPKIQSKIKTIEVFVDAEEMISSANNPIEEEIEKLKHQPVVITAGRLSAEKGFQYLIQVFSHVRSRVPDAKLVLIGDGPQYQMLMDMCKLFKLSISDGKSNIQESAVVFLGYRNTPHRYFHIARVFVLSSLTEGFSNITLEALASGVPVLAVNCPWGPRSILCEKAEDIISPYPTEDCTQKDYGMLMPRIDQEHFHEKWVDTLSCILKTPPPDKKSLEICQNRVRNFDFSVVGCKWLDLVDSLFQDASK